MMRTGRTVRVDGPGGMNHRNVMPAFCKKLALVGLLTFVSTALSSPVADYDAGAEAYTAGDYAAARAEWRDLAEVGDPDSQFGMGLIYESGRGVGLEGNDPVYRSQAWAMPDVAEAEIICATFKGCDADCFLVRE